jgi:signal transduction histidine kinase
VKLKAIFVIFNILIGVSFLFVVFMPAFFLGWEYAAVFWASNWYLALLFLLVLGILNTYFVYNWRLFTALQNEDWDAVILALEKRVFERKRYAAGNIRLLVNAYVVRARTEAISRLEEELRAHKPKVLRKNALLIGIPHLLSNDGAEIATYYGEFVKAASGRRKEWLRWSFAFGRMLEQRPQDARETLDDLCDNASDPIVRALSGYLLEAYAQKDESERQRIDACREVITSSHSAVEWDALVEKARTDLYVLILSKLLRDVREWLYRETL